MKRSEYRRDQAEYAGAARHCPRGAARYAVIGPVSGVVGAGTLPGFAAGYATLSSAVVLTLPAIRFVIWGESPAGLTAAPD